MDQLAKSKPRLVFITGTDTGVGKTFLTALLLRHLRRRKVPTLAVKPFCSGDRNDPQLLAELQGGDLQLDEINPFFFPEPLAPLVAARMVGRSVDLPEVIGHIRSILQRFDGSHLISPHRRNQAPVLLIEGAGGLLVPLGCDFSFIDLIHALRCEVVIVARNKLGTINHTLLAVRALQSNFRAAQTAVGQRRNASPSLKVLLMDQEIPDASTTSNAKVLAELLAPVPVHTVPFFEGNCAVKPAVERIEKKIQKTLARILV